jgi:hypothetical protein
VETDTHFPTDYSILWDSARKCMDTVKHLDIPGWRKSKSWRRELKNLMRAVGKASSSAGHLKVGRARQAAPSYLKKARALENKVTGVLASHTPENVVEALSMEELFYYYGMLPRHIDLLDRRLVKGEVIAHAEKVFSIFQPYAEMIKKGKLRPNVEIGKKQQKTRPTTS